MLKHLKVLAHSVGFHAVMITLVVAVGLTLASQNKKPNTLSSVEPLMDQEFTTVLPELLRTGGSQVIDNTESLEEPTQPVQEQPEETHSATEGEPVELKPQHSSDILDALDDFEQDEFYATLTPNDTSYPLWYLDQIGAPSAWDISTGSSDVVVAVIDSGYALGHQELSNRWHINTDEQGSTTPGDICWTGSSQNRQTNNCDDDDNGYIDDWRGWDFNGIDNSPQAGEVDPSGSGVAHGTLVAGVLASTGNNSTGFPGLDWNARIMPLQALSDNGTGYTSDIVAAIEYAVDNGADIINLSLGGPIDNLALFLSLSYARSQDVLVISSSGNCATLAYTFCSQLQAPGYLSYPALYDEVLAIGALNSVGNRASFSSYGPELDLVAPGQGLTISSTWSPANPTSNYASNISGTSFSAPIASGIASLVRAANPDLNVEDVRRLLIESTTAPSNNIFTNELGFGLLRADKALEAAVSNDASNVNRTNRDQPLINSSTGTDPGNPIGANSTLTSTLISYPGDQIKLRALNASTGQRITVGDYKTGDNGVAQAQWQTSQLGAGIWQLQANGLQLSSLTEVIYIVN